MTTANSLSLEDVVDIAQKILFNNWIRAFRGNNQIQINPNDSGGFQCRIIEDLERRGLVLEVQTSSMPATSTELFKSIVHDQAFKGPDRSDLAVQIADVLYVGARAVQLLGRHS